MNLGAVSELIVSWLKTQGMELLRAETQPRPQGNFQPGQQYDGQVLENLPNGRSLVKVADQTLDMALPQQSRPGDVVRLTFVQPGPRPTFVLNVAETGTTQPVTVSQAAQQVNALTRLGSLAETGATAPAQPQQAAAASPANSAAAMAGQHAVDAKPIVANPAILLAAATGGAGAQAAGMGPAIPAALLPDEAVNSPQASVATNAGLTTAQGVTAGSSANQALPAHLQQTVKESGLFYESHLGKWVRGEIGLETVLREPQAKLAEAPGRLLNLPDLEGMPAKAAHLASRQLNMLEGAPFFWQGQVWPGQNMEWQVADREAGGNTPPEDIQKWHSNLRLRLPRLGGVVADLDVGALGLRVRITPEAPETAAEMQAALPELAERLRAADLNLTSLQVGRADGGE